MAPSLAVRTARSATPFVSGRPGVDVGCGQPISLAARINSGELSEKKLLTTSFGPTKCKKDAYPSSADLLATG